MLLKLKPSIYAPLVKLIAVGLDIIALVSFQQSPLDRFKLLDLLLKSNLSQSAVQAAFNDHQTGGTEENDFELGVDFDDMVRSVCRKCTFDSFTNHVYI